MLAAAAALATGAGAFGASAYAADYQPSTADSRYGNVLDVRNGIGISGIDLACSNGEANARTVAAASELDAIGTAGDQTSPIVFANGLDQAITSLSVKASGDADFGSNVLSGALQPGDSLCWNWVYDGKLTDHENKWSQSFKMTPTYTFRATLSDGTQATFHTVNMNGVRTVDFKHSDSYGVYYVERTTITNHTPDPNLYYEVQYAAEGADEETVNQWINGSAYQGDATEDMAFSSPQYTGATYDSLAASINLYGVPCENDKLYQVYEPISWNRDDLVWSSTHQRP